MQALERTFGILNCFTFQNIELSLSDIVSQTRLHKTTAKRFIANLTAWGYLLLINKLGDTVKLVRETCDKVSKEMGYL